MPNGFQLAQSLGVGFSMWAFYPVMAPLLPGEQQRRHPGGILTPMATDEAARWMHVPVERDGATDRVAVEEPLEIRVRGEALAVTMRTPGHDEELALGFLIGEGLITTPSPAGPAPDLAANVVDIDADLAYEPGQRRFYTSSSCGLCGKGALEEVEVHAPTLPPGPQVTRELLASLPARLAQPAFDATGGLHATGLFTPGGEL